MFVCLFVNILGWCPLMCWVRTTYLLDGVGGGAIFCSNKVEFSWNLQQMFKFLGWSNFDLPLWSDFSVTNSLTDLQINCFLHGSLSSTLNFFQIDGTYSNLYGTDWKPHWTCWELHRTGWEPLGTDWEPHGTRWNLYGTSILNLMCVWCLCVTESVTG